MKIPYMYSFKNFRSRKLTTAVTVAGIALVVFVFAAVLMMARGVQQTLMSTGSPDNVMIVRKSATGEISSYIRGETQNIIKTLPHIAKTSDGTPITSNEPVAVIILNKPNGGFSNVAVRGVSSSILSLRPQVRIIEGRMHNPSMRELIVGESIAEKYPEARIGRTVKVGGDHWRVVGIFTTEGSGFDSEIWGGAVQVLDALNRGNTVSTLTLKLDDPANFDQMRQAFKADRRLQQFEPKIEQEYFGEQSEGLAGFIRMLGIFVTVVFSAGATVGAMITMYTSVANRTVEIGTLRALGFSRNSIQVVFLIESLMIALIGGAVGIFLASFLRFFSVSTLNFQSFSELAFSFALSPSIIISSMTFALLMGLLGGFLPSVRAAELNIASALRGE